MQIAWPSAAVMLLLPLSTAADREDPHRLCVTPPTPTGTPPSATAMGGWGAAAGGCAEAFDSLHDALDAAAGRPTPTTIHLAPGQHLVRRPLTLGPEHASLAILGHGRASISAGVEVRGWRAAGPAHCAGCSQIWRAPTPPGLDSRQFYVNGVRANRTWLAFPPNATKNATTLTVPGSTMRGWTRNASAIDLVYRGGKAQPAPAPPAPAAAAAPPPPPRHHHTATAPPRAPASPNSASRQHRRRLTHPWPPRTLATLPRSHRRRCPAGASAGSQWQESRCPVASLASSASAPATTVVHVAQPCVTNGNNKIKGTQPLTIPAYVENVFELLGSGTGRAVRCYAAHAMLHMSCCSYASCTRHVNLGF